MTSEEMEVVAQMGAKIAGLQASVEALGKEKEALGRECEEARGIHHVFARAQAWKQMDTNTSVFRIEVDNWTLRAGGKEAIIGSLKKLMDSAEGRSLELPPREAPVTDHPTCGPDADAPQGPMTLDYRQCICRFDGMLCTVEPTCPVHSAIRVATLADVERVVEGEMTAHNDTDWSRGANAALSDVLAAIRAMRETTPR